MGVIYIGLIHFYWKNDDECLDLTFESDMFEQLKIN